MDKLINFGDFLNEKLKNPFKRRENNIVPTEKSSLKYDNILQKMDGLSLEELYGMIGNYLPNLWSNRYKTVLGLTKEDNGTYLPIGYNEERNLFFNYTICKSDNLCIEFNFSKEPDGYYYMLYYLDQKSKNIRSKNIRMLINKSIEIINNLEYNYYFDEEI